MADFIGAFNFVAVNGQLDPPATELEPIEALGRDGRAYRALGKRGAETTLRAGRDYLGAWEANDALVLYKQSIGTVVNIVQYSEIRGTYMILGVKEVEGSRTDTVNRSGGQSNGPHWMETEWRVVHVPIV